MHGRLPGSKLLSLLALLLFANGLNSIHAQQPSRPVSQIAGPIQTEQRTKIPHSTHPLIRGAADKGEVSGSNAMNHMLLVLTPTPQKQAALEQFLADRQNPHSANYHKWLTPAQFGQQFGPSQADIDSVTNWLTTQGLTVSAVSQGRRTIDFSGTVSQVNDVFRTSIHSFQINGASHIANATDISIPSALTPLVSGVVRLNNIYKKTPIGISGRMQRNGAGKLTVSSYSALKDGVAASTSSPQLTDGTLQYLTPGDLAQIYDAASLTKAGTDGTGASIAVIGRSNVQLSDMQSFRQLFNLPANDPQIVLVGPDPGTGSQDEVESALDLEYAGALAPKATIKFVTAQSTDTADGVDLAAMYAVDTMVAPVITESYGSCEALMGTAENQFISSLWQQAAAEGISVILSAGDSGSAACDAPVEYTLAEDGLAVSGLASTPYNTAVGGTMFDSSALGAPFWNTTNQSGFVTANGYIPENVWNETCDPTLPITATGNCAEFFTEPRFAEPMLYAGAGGASSCTQSTQTTNPDGTLNITCSGGHAKPSWQTGPGVPADGVRDVPDVSLAAAGDTAPYTICVEGSCQFSDDGQGNIELAGASFVGGTSAAAPTFAGVVALINQKAGASQGLLNYKLYQLAAAPGASCDSSQQTDPTDRGACIFHDITKGSNAVPCVGGTPDCTSTDPSVSGTLKGYNATAGYDEATGLGSIDAANLVAAWGSANTAASVTALSATNTTVQHGQPVQLNGTVTAATGSAVPTGSVSFVSSTGTAVEAIALTNGSFSDSVTNLPGGSYTLTANYPGDASFSASTSSPVSVNISPEGSTTKVTVLAVSETTGAVGPGATSQFGDNLLLRADVAGASGKGVATGNVTLLLDGKSIGSYPPNPQGTVEIITGVGASSGLFPAIGTHTLSASFAGDSSFNASSSTTASFAVNKADDSTDITVGNPNPITGQQILVNVYVTTNTPQLPTNPSGTVQLLDNGAAVATGTLEPAGGLSSGGSKAVIPYTFTTSGQHTLTANYKGDATFNAAQYVYSSTYTVTDGHGVASLISVNPSSTKPTIGQGVTFLVSVAAKTAVANAPAPTGTVALTGATQTTFFNSGSVVLPQYGPAEVVATFQAAGATPVYITYSGDSYYAPSSSVIMPVNVQKIAVPLTLTPSTTLLTPGSQIAVQATMIASTTNNSLPIPTGSVQFYDSVNGAAPVAVGVPHQFTFANGAAFSTTGGVTTLATPLAAGTHIITASYAGDVNYMPANGTTAAITVTAPDFTLTAASTSVALPVGSSATADLQVQPVLGFVGEVSLACDSTSVPTGVQCAVSPNQLASGAGNATLTLTAASAGAGTSTAQARPYRTQEWLAAALAPCFGLLLFGRRRRRLAVYLALSFFVCTAATLSGCGGGSGVHAATIQLTSNSEKVAAESTVTYMATVASPGSDAPTGSVTFSADGKPLGQPAALVSGTAKLDSSALPVGIHAITATYNGDQKHSSATSGDYAQAITGSANVNVVATSGSSTHPLTIAVNLQ